MIKASAEQTVTEIGNGTDCSQHFSSTSIRDPAGSGEPSKDHTLMFKQPQMKIQNPPMTLEPGPRRAHT